MLILGVQLVVAQPKSRKFGKVEKELVEMTEYAQDPDASAVILYERGHVKFGVVNEKLQIVLTVHRRIKLLSESATGQADIEVPFYSYGRYEKVSLVKGYTHNFEDGKVVSQKLDRKAVFVEDQDGYWSKTTFTLPNAKPGSVVEYSYQLSSQDLGNLRTWYFQGQIPTLYSELMVDLPRDFNYRRMFRGEPVQIENKTENFKDVTYGFEGDRQIYMAKNIPAMKEEPFTTTVDNFVSRLDHELVNISIPGSYYKDYTTTWTQLNKTIISGDTYAAYLKGNRSVKEVVASIKTKYSEPQAQIAALLQYVQENIRWNGKRGIYPSPGLNKMMEEKKGNGSALNVALVSMLREAGFSARPVLISTRTHGSVAQAYPLMSQFNHAIAMVEMDEGYVLLDGTDVFCPPGMLPFADLNGQGIALGETGFRWVKLSSGHKRESKAHGSFSLLEDGTLEGKMNYTDMDYDGSGWRRKIYKMDEKEEEYVKERITENMPNGELGDFTVENYRTYSQPLKTEANINTDDFASVAGDFLYLEPMLGNGYDKNPFTLEERSYPVDFGAPMHERYMLNLILPDGYTVEELPEATKVVLPGSTASFTYSAQAIGNQLQLISDITFKQAVYQPKDYQYLRNFFDLIVKKHGEQIVLKKVSK